jgi:phasin family protein
MTERKDIQFDQVFGPARRFLGIAVDHTEQLTRFQLESARAYADLGLKQARGLLAVNDQRSLQAYLEQQRQVADEFTRKVTDDAETLAGFSRSFSDATAELVRDNVARTQANVEEATRRSA